MDSPWDDDPGNTAHCHAEWSKLSSDFTNAGYREGITAGKESALQSGFDTGFATIGSPLGQKIGRMRGTASAVLEFLTSTVKLSSSAAGSTANEALITEAHEMVSKLANIRFSDIVPRDMEAEEHARQHLGDEMVQNEETTRRNDILARLSAGPSDKAKQGRPPTDADIEKLQLGLEKLVLALGLTTLRSKSIEQTTDDITTV